MIKAIAQATAVVVTIVIGGLALWQMREAVQLLLVALAVSAGISPAIGYLRDRGLRREWAIGTTVLLALMTVGLLLLVLGSQLLLELEQIVGALPGGYDQLRALLSAQGALATDIALALPSSSALIAQITDPEALPQLLMALATRVTIGVILVIGAVSLGAYWLIDQARIERLWFSLLPLQARARTRTVWIRVYYEVGLYVRGGVILAGVTSAFLLLAYRVLELPGATLLALFGGVALIVPVLGPTLAVVPPLLVALTRAPETALATLIAVSVSIALVKAFVSPRLFRDGIVVNPVLTIICIMALGEVGGIGLILLGPPLAAAIQTAVQALRSEAGPSQEPAESEAVALRDLQARLDNIAAAAPPAPQVQSLIDRARALVEAAGAGR